MKILISLYLLLYFSGCSLLNLRETEEITIKSEQIESFKDLLKQGWIIQVYNKKVFLVKTTNQKVYILDIFNLLEEE